MRRRSKAVWVIAIAVTLAAVLRLWIWFDDYRNDPHVVGVATTDLLDERGRPLGPAAAAAELERRPDIGEMTARYTAVAVAITTELDATGLARNWTDEQLEQTGPCRGVDRPEARSVLVGTWSTTDVVRDDDWDRVVGIVGRHAAGFEDHEHFTQEREHAYALWMLDGYGGSIYLQTSPGTHPEGGGGIPRGTRLNLISGCHRAVADS